MGSTLTILAERVSLREFTGEARITENFISIMRKLAKAFPVIAVGGTLVIFVLGFVMHFTRSYFIYELLREIGIICFIFSVLLFVCKFSGFFAFIKLKNPIGDILTVPDIAAVSALWAIIIYLSVAIGIWSPPEARSIEEEIRGIRINTQNIRQDIQDIRTSSQNIRQGIQDIRQDIRTFRGEMKEFTKSFNERCPWPEKGK